MKGLLTKDFSYFLKDIKLYAVMIVFYIVLFTVTGMDSSGMMGMLMFFSFLISMNSFSFDDYNNWNRYALTMPLDRKDLVLGKYVYGLLGIIATTIVAYVATIGVGLANGEVGFEFKNVAVASLIVGSIVIIFMSILFPILFKLGAEKARMFMMAIFIVPAMIGFLGAKVFPNQLESIINFFMGIGPVVTGIGYGVIVLLGLAISIRASINIMIKKEF